VLHRLYSTEPDPAAILRQLKPIRNWGSVMERAWKLGLIRLRNLSPWGSGRATVAPIGLRQNLNPTGLRRDEYRHVGTLWEGRFIAPEGRNAGESLASLQEVSPAMCLVRGDGAVSFSDGLSEVPPRTHTLQTTGERVRLVDAHAIEGLVLLADQVSNDQCWVGG
jgi:hypothetical protein